MPRVDIRGVIVPNDYAIYYDFWGEDYTCPRNVQQIIDSTVDGDNLDVYINSPGGVIDCGSEIYTMLRQAKERTNMKIYVTGEACSAASIISMAGYCEMAPTALMMVHCVSTYGGGNHSDFEHIAEMLSTADKALCQAYVAKTGMSEEEALQMMEHETWLTANLAKEKGLIDGIMFEENKPDIMMNAVGFNLPSEEKLAEARTLMEAKKKEAEMAAFEEELSYLGEPIKNSF